MVNVSTTHTLLLPQLSQRRQIFAPRVPADVRLYNVCKTHKKKQCKKLFANNIKKPLPDGHNSLCVYRCTDMCLYEIRIYIRTGRDRQLREGILSIGLRGQITFVCL